MLAYFYSTTRETQIGRKSKSHNFPPLSDHNRVRILGSIFQELVMRTGARVFMFVAVLFAANSVSAQRPEAPRETVTRAFASAPKVGEPLPDVTVYDDAGREFPLASLRGKHAVLVFGCLT
jgi:hypothetical protein